MGAMFDYQKVLRTTSRDLDSLLAIALLTLVQEAFAQPEPLDQVKETWKEQIWKEKICTRWGPPDISWFINHEITPSN